MKVYVVDDERIIRISLADGLRELGYEVFEFASARPALLQIKTDMPDIVITDLKMPDISGIDFLKKIKEFNSDIYVVLMTAYSDVSTAVEAMKLGAYDYVEKPFDNEKIIIIVKRVVEFLALKGENKVLRKELKKEYDFSTYVGNSPKIKETFELAKVVANKTTSILIIGETGTGKELLTKIIHHNSNRRNGPLIKVSCAILSREIFESELFGHEKGSFTGAIDQKIGRFELANGGTLYLDDIDDVPIDLQVKLLRALEEREIERVGGKNAIKIDIRVIASTKKDLKIMVDEGTFRQDLFYRLNVFPVTLPPLRERPGDIVALTKHYVKYFSEGEIIQIKDEVFDVLLKYKFPGNIRELKNLCERLTLLTINNTIDCTIIPYEIKYPGTILTGFTFTNKTLTKIIEEVEINAIREALDKAHGNKAKAAESLGLPATTLKSKILKFNL